MEAMEIQGFVEPEELEWLSEHAQNAISIVEIGCWKGRSAFALASACPEGKVYTVDTFNGSPSEMNAAHAEAVDDVIYDQAVMNLGEFRNLEIMRMTSLQASRLFSTESIDMIFIDGEHTTEAVLIDLLSWYPKCRSIICGHDLGIQSVQEALAVFGIPFELGAGSIWYMEKKWKKS